MQQSADGRQTPETRLNSIMAGSNTQHSRQRSLRDAVIVAAAAVMTAAVVGTAVAAVAAAAMTHQTAVTHPPRPNVVIPGLTAPPKGTVNTANALTMTPDRDTPTRGRGGQAKAAKGAAGTAKQTLSGQNVTGKIAVCNTAAGVAAQGRKARWRTVVAGASAAVVESTAGTANLIAAAAAAAPTNAAAAAAAAESTVAVEAGAKLQDIRRGQEGMGLEVL